MPTCDLPRRHLESAREREPWVVSRSGRRTRALPLLGRQSLVGSNLAQSRRASAYARSPWRRDAAARRPAPRAEWTGWVRPERAARPKWTAHVRSVGVRPELQRVRELSGAPGKEVTDRLVDCRRSTGDRDHRRGRTRHPCRDWRRNWHHRRAGSAALAGRLPTAKYGNPGCARQPPGRRTSPRWTSVLPATRVPLEPAAR